MTASLAAFADSIQILNMEELRSFLIEMEKERQLLNVMLTEFQHTSTELHRSYSQMETELRAAQKNLRETEKKYAKVCEQNTYLSKQVYGRSSEKTAALECLGQEDYVDPLSESAMPEQTVSVSSHKKENSHILHPSSGKHGHKRAGWKNTVLEKLPVYHEYELDVEKLDSLYGAYNWRIYGWHTSTTVEKTPAIYYRKVTHTAVVSVGLEHQLVSIQPENRLYRYSLASSSLVASIIYNKFFLSLPLYRQEKDLTQAGFYLTRQTMSAWILHFSGEIFSLVYDRLQEEVLSCPYNQCDETTLEVILDSRNAGSKSYIWVHSTSELAGGHPVVVYCFELTRGTDHLRSFYKNYTGTITSDAYQAYPLLEKETDGRIRITGCGMHVRRRFADALNLISLKSLSEEERQELPENKAIALIGEIYSADEPLKEVSIQERTERRNTEVRPKAEDFFSYIHTLDPQNPAYSEKMKDAISYACNQEVYLKRFLEDGNIPIDNGAAERFIKPVALGRRNWLFCNTVAGAEASCMLYSIVETAAANGASVYFYLKYLLEKIPKHLDGKDLKFLEDMLPWSPAYQEYEASAIKLAASVQIAGSASEAPRTPRKRDALNPKIVA